MGTQGNPSNAIDGRQRQSQEPPNEKLFDFAASRAAQRVRFAALPPWRQRLGRALMIVDTVLIILLVVGTVVLKGLPGVLAPGALAFLGVALDIFITAAIAIGVASTFIRDERGKVFVVVIACGYLVSKLLVLFS